MNIWRIAKSIGRSVYDRDRSVGLRVFNILKAKPQSNDAPFADTNPAEVAYAVIKAGRIWLLCAIILVIWFIGASIFVAMPLYGTATILSLLAVSLVKLWQYIVILKTCFAAEGKTLRTTEALALLW